ncbi:putative dehydrogenase/reductase SDR family member 11 [Apostichopus japonicus]|uniref:Putative dehydrogenase/reductase SDR family member 11 n=1 Tax=Stichopus japonicus TaxID=307972 RepID=A0A2G8KRR8_STIJA|nr:putative dehydrogenase/reductase SDR family member 11 [Apostichopus japonicus]
MANSSRWVGRVAIVTGGSAGIGEATVRLLVKEGMKVVVCARKLEGLQTLAAELNQNKAESSVLPVQCDVSQEAQVLEMFNKIRSEFGRVDICINNAGINLGNAGLLDGSTESWQQIINVNVIGLCICTRESIKLMREKGIDDGHVIHISSFSGHRVPGSSLLHFYSASKYAVNACTEGLRQELRAIKSNIRVSSLSPGLVETDFNKVAMKGDFDEFMSSKQTVSPEDIAQLVWTCICQPAHVQIHDILVRPTQQVH